jgi:hypothetical protein
MSKVQIMALLEMLQPAQLPGYKSSGTSSGCFVDPITIFQNNSNSMQKWLHQCMMITVKGPDYGTPGNATTGSMPGVQIFRRLIRVLSRPYYNFFKPF